MAQHRPASGAVVALRPAEPPRLTLGMRTVLGFLHAGALFRQPGGGWRSRAFPQERVLDVTVRALEKAGFARLEEFPGLDRTPRCCAVLTIAGREAYRGGRFEARRPPPLLVEGVLHETERLEAEIAARQDRLDTALSRMAAEAREARAAAARIESRLARIETHAARIDAERERIRASRADIRAVADEACRRIGDELARAGR